MNLTILSAIVGVLVFIGLFVAAFALFGKKGILERRVGVTDGDGKSKTGKLKQLASNTGRLVKPLGDMLPRSPEEMSRQERRLVAAGIRLKDGPVLFYGVKIALAILLFIVSTSLGFPYRNPLGDLVLSVFFGAAIPDLWLARRGRNRKELIQLAIPDVLDLTVVCVEAGLGLDQALMRIGHEVRYNHPDLSDELRLYNLETNAGRSRADALRNLAKRTEVDDLKALTAVLIQTDRFGTSIAQSLRVFSESLRTKRRQRAEERAAKTTIKMIPVLVFFVFPAIFIVVVFPAFLAIIRELLPRIGGGK